MSHCGAASFSKLNETVQTAPKRRKENNFYFGDVSLIMGSEIWYMHVVSFEKLFELWIQWIGVEQSRYCIRWSLYESDGIALSFASLFRLSNWGKNLLCCKHLYETQNKITETYINERKNRIS